MKKSELNTESRVTIQTKIESIKNAAGQEPSPVTKPNITEIQTDFNLHKKIVLLAEAEKKAAEDELVQLEQDKVALDKGTNDLNNEKEGWKMTIIVKKILQTRLKRGWLSLKKLIRTSLI